MRDDLCCRRRSNFGNDVFVSADITVQVTIE
jgi:hypothetical protein